MNSKHMTVMLVALLLIEGGCLALAQTGDVRTRKDRWEAQDRYVARQRAEIAKAEGHAEKGWTSLHAGDLRTAESEYLEAIRIHNDDRYRFALGRIYERMNRPADAFRVYGSVLKPQDGSSSTAENEPVWLLRYAVLARKLGDLGEAEWAANKAWENRERLDDIGGNNVLEMVPRFGGSIARYPLNVVSELAFVAEFYGAPDIYEDVPEMPNGHLVNHESDRKSFLAALRAAEAGSKDPRILAIVHFVWAGVYSSRFYESERRGEPIEMRKKWRKAQYDAYHLVARYDRANKYFYSALKSYFGPPDLAAMYGE
ncbi:MAG: hypothetical protein SFU56_11415 [Capsulimonadales bacterium]|nr:hypothetical protein [Capsulimonadales bacterium]